MDQKRFLFGVVMALPFSATGVAQCTSRAQLNVFERRQFVQVSHGQRGEVSAQFLSELGCGRQMLDSLNALGAEIDYSDERSGYVLVNIPREKLLATLDIAGVAYAYTRDDDRIYYQDPAAQIPQSERKAEPVPTIAIPYPRVAKTLASDGPFFDAGVIGLTKLWRQHPEADGRGVRVAVPDEGFDLLHPALQEARNAAGAIVPKVADLSTVTPPKEDSAWVQFGDALQTRDGQFEAAGRTWGAPADGTYRFGIFKQELVLGPEENSLSTKLSLSVGVLWDEQGHKVWVDTNGDGNFRDERALGDYGQTDDIAWFGTKEGEGDNRIPFGVKIDQARGTAYIRIGVSHGTLVGGPLAANRLTGGLFDGAAPSAQLIDSNSNRASYLAEIVEMFRRPDVDVINRSGGLGRAGYTGAQEGVEDFAQRVVERVIAVYGKPIATFSGAVGTIHVNDYADSEMLRRNRQVGPPYKDTINGRFPFLQNGLVNAVVAPSANLITASRYRPFVLTGQDGKRSSFSDDYFEPPAPAGYEVGANNSPTIPVVSGVLADLISEAKRENIRFNAVRLNNAIFTGARLLDSIPTSQQGYGLVNASQAWAQLRKMAKADDPKNSELTNFTISQNEAGKTIEAQGFHADIARPGATIEGEIWVTRHGGYAGGRKYTFRLRGDDQSFTLVDHEATLVRDEATRIRFRSSGAPGWNIAFLDLRDAKADVVLEDVPLSVRAPEVPEKVAPGVDRYQSIIPPLTSEQKYVRVNVDTQAARYVMKIPFTGPENISTRSGPGLHYRPDKSPPGGPVDAAHHVGPLETLDSLVANDAPGNQLIFWENRGRPEYATQYDGPAPDVSIHAELTVTKYAVGIERDGDALVLKNEQAAIDGRTELYDAALRTQSLTGAGLHAMGEIERTVPDHLAEWRLRVTVDEPLDGPADVYALNCTGKNGCYVAATQEISDSGKPVVIDKPQPGAWKIVIRSRNQEQHPQTYSIQEALLTPSANPIETTDSQHASGSTWTVALPHSANAASHSSPAPAIEYAAFHIAGTPGVASEKNGLLIAMTPLDPNTP
ncbi:MAG TPA: S8 family serine peptidase [Terracidiphilus sp.]